MKVLITNILSFIFISCFSQVPVMNPITGSSVVCSSPSAPLSFSASASNSPTSYSWSISTPSTGVVIGNVSASVTSISFPYTNGTYTLYCSATNSAGTSATESLIVTVFETPSVTFSGANTFCQGSSTNLSASSTILAASPTIFYNWSPGTGLNTTIGQNVIANPAFPIVYTVTATKGPCSNTAQILITPLNSPTITVSPTFTSGCYGYSTALTASGANTFTWTNSIINSVPFTPLFSNSYFVTGTASNGCTNTASVYVTVNPLPTLIVSSSSSVLCKGNSATLSLNGDGNSFSVNATSSSSTVVISPSVTTTYTIVTSSIFSCTTTQIFTQLVASCVGIKEMGQILDTPFKIYPNPNSGSFVILSNQKSVFTIQNELGQIIKIIDLIPNVEFRISGLTSGVYTIHNGFVKQKMVVTN